MVYVSGEEAADQVRLRAIRLGLGGAPVRLAAATSVRDILTTVSSGEPPALLVIDPIQTMHSDLIEGAPGTVSQVRASAQELVRFAKDRAPRWCWSAMSPRTGPSPGRACSSIWSTPCWASRASAATSIASSEPAKNRFGGTDEIGVFAMEGGGLIEVPNPSALFLTQRGEPVSGTSVFPALEGTRRCWSKSRRWPCVGQRRDPRRSAVGWDSGRLAMILAVLEARCGISFATAEVYLNVAGGYRLSDPAADLAVAAALVSALSEQPVPQEAVIMGEIALSGESPAGRACRTAPQGSGQAGLRPGLGADGHRGAERNLAEPLW